MSDPTEKSTPETETETETDTIHQQSQPQQNHVKPKYTPKYAPTSHHFIPRYNGPTTSQMTPDQKSIHQSIIQSRPHTGISGPFGPWLSVPSIAHPAQELGRACRYNTSLSMRESELVILLTGARHGSHAEFDIHVGEAVRAGIGMEVIEAIPRDEDFSVQAVEERVVPVLPFLFNQNKDQDDQGEGQCQDGKCSQNGNGNSDREIQIVKFVAELLETSTVSDETYNSAREVLGHDSVLVEITSIVGYYTFCAYTLNVFRIPTKKKKNNG